VYKAIITIVKQYLILMIRTFMTPRSEGEHGLSDRVLIIDGYTDEPSMFGVPPYISPYVRYIYGAVLDAGGEVRYKTIDEFRGLDVELRKKLLSWADIIVIHRAVIVPGKYLGGTPIKFREVMWISENARGKVILGGSVASYGFGGIGGHKPISIETLRDYVDYLVPEDVDAFVYDLIVHKKASLRHRTQNEWKRWAVLGARLVRDHNWYPYIICEIETYQGCHRFITGGCSFCMEPLRAYRVRDEEDIVAEAEALYKNGVRYIRIGGQPCFYSYKAIGFGYEEIPRPNVNAIRRLLVGINNVGEFRVIHIDNGNPSVIANWPDEAKEVTKLLVSYASDGNVVALGMESADPRVIKENNLNATPEEVIKAVEIINSVGAVRGPSGMPWILPGINILFGLRGERKETYRINYEFLKEILDRGLLLRRINIREVVPIRGKFPRVDVRLVHHWKEKIRRDIDLPMLRRVVPKGTILKNVFMEIHEGNYTKGRQLGTYPLLVVVPYSVELRRFYDVKIIDHGYRSVTGLIYPIDINKASLKELMSVPGISKKLAGKLLAKRPLSVEELKNMLPRKSWEYFKIN